MAVEVAALDLWDLFVNNIFGGFIMAVAGITLLIFIIMGILGRMSIYSTTWYCIMFLLAMGLGYGYAITSIAITLMLIISLIFSITSYINSK